jgi:hypothetical protein
MLTPLQEYASDYPRPDVQQIKGFIGPQGTSPILRYGRTSRPASLTQEVMMARGDGGNTGGIGLGGILVMVGIVLMIIWSFWIGLIIALVGLVAFGGFARGKWY